MTQNRIRKFLLILISILLLNTLYNCSNFRKDPDLNLPENSIEKIDEVIQTLFENDQFSGTILVSVKGKIIYKNAVGLANMKDSILNSCDTKFRIASFTKPFTAMLILQLMEDGQIELEGKLTDYLPEFTVKGGENITIHQLLTHTAGITGEWRIPDLVDIEKKYYSREKLLECIMKRDLVYKPGTKSEYSNFGYALLGLVIEKVSGKSYEEVLYEKICNPSGMKNTLSDVTSQPISKRAIGYNYNYFTGIEEASFLDMSFVFGYGHLLSTVEDLYLFDKALYTNKLLTESSKKLFFDKYGWFSERYSIGNVSKKIRSYTLDGSINGFQSHTHRIEKDSVFIVALRNIKEYKKEIVIKWPSSMIPQILAILYGKEYDLQKKSAAFTIFKTLIESGQDEAENTCDEVLNKFKDKYYSDDREFDFFEIELRKNDMDRQADLYCEFKREL